jgi:RimJ/RimL family protein N-acetyltransferase
MDPLPLTTPRLSIRLLRPDDADALYRIYGDPEAMRYIGSTGKARTRDQTGKSVAGFIADREKHGFGLWATDLRTSGEMIGMCGLIPVEGTGPDVEVVYVLERPAWGRGYATEMARACLDAGFAAFGLERIIALAYPANGPSIRVMQKAGMHPAGTMHAHGHDLLCYEALADEGPGGRPSRSPVGRRSGKRA